MKIVEIKNRSDILITKLFNLWQESVRDSHHFLDETAIKTIGEIIPTALENIEHLIVVYDNFNTIQAFMGIESHKIEMLFVASNMQGKGIGKRLIKYAINTHDITEITVNEQNIKAYEFYKHIGFKAFKRDEKDDMGNPYPIVHMQL
ncbi:MULTISPECIES: GNAT family N-acetyltransferase [unclassified Enterococcus]|uniref:GNAT family N-acetyltransferase n=1 Tax=unclassified Enterococcus TaxID=2608891 RepID=UPI0015528C87|nr:MULTISPECIES: GNAT family N-acetyltransferase [unclassified Enterococcus]MBS7576115.1 GNAT family N-acetyltransferase [Enterococcus sp. MMGLQ5-2]MBS7583348.1 GNAT family N-acetyltransferase [Enterococcus sp. MMGLQ5-1]NPD11208.1 GNAT family N-acetyltransferase [Enterococcus sp. MMGLQ5-1]NPD35951.1 GNAT family N-acetyltransferase [Enterococcus sp. MMGLQ5-2]